MSNCDGGLAHSSISTGTGEGTRGDELQTLLGIIHPSEQLFFPPSWNSFPLAAPDSAETLARATASSLLVPKVQLSFSGGSQSRLEAAPVSSKRPPSSLEEPGGSIREAAGGAWMADGSLTLI